MTTFYLMRHGETEWNVQGRMQGQKDSPLTAKGLEEAAHRAKDLKDTTFDLVFSSDLLRAKRTAEIIALEHRLAVEATRLLRERFMGHAEGMKWKEFRKKYQKDLDKMATLSLEEQAKFRLGENETNEEMMTRFFTFIREIAIAHDKASVLAVSHGGMISVVLRHLGIKGEHQESKVKNLGYIVFRSDGSDIVVDKLVDIEIFDKDEKRH